MNQYNILIVSAAKGGRNDSVSYIHTYLCSILRIMKILKYDLFYS